MTVQHSAMVLREAVYLWTNSEDVQLCFRSNSGKVVLNAWVHALSL